MFPRPAGVNLRSLGSFWISPGLSFLCLGRLVFSNIAMKFDRIPDSMSCGTIWHIIWPNRLPRGRWGGGGARKPIFCRCVRRILTRVLYAYLQHYLSFCSCARRKKYSLVRWWCFAKNQLADPSPFGLICRAPPHGCLCGRPSVCLPIPFCLGPMRYRRETENVSFFSLARWWSSRPPPRNLFSVRT